VSFTTARTLPSYAVIVDNILMLSFQVVVGLNAVTDLNKVC